MARPVYGFSRVKLSYGLTVNATPLQYGKATEMVL